MIADLQNAKKIIRIAMWSGPRNISTAMLRSFGHRLDTFPHDEPFYAHYLEHTGLDHPGAAEVMAHHETDWREVVKQLLGPIPDGKTIYYQKHMAHHLLPHFERDWFNQLEHAFLIRNPKDMLLSLSKKLNNITLGDTGLPQQWQIFEYVRDQLGQTPPVIDGADVRNHPRAALTALCNALAIPFDQAMLAWPAGRRQTDGVWAKYWYGAVEKSTCFQPYVTSPGDLPERYQSLLQDCQKFYDRLAEFRLPIPSNT